MQREIQTTLEKEAIALDGDVGRSRDSDAEGDQQGAPLNSVVLLGDVEEVKQKVDKYHSRIATENLHSTKHATDSLLACYR